VKYFARNSLVAVVAILSLAVTAINANATPVSGEVLFAGKFSGNARVFGAMTRFNSFSDVTVTGGSGLYETVPSVPVSMQGFSFTSLPSPVLDIWEFTAGGITYNFDLSSVEIVSRDRGTMVLQGTGFAQISGFESAAGTWTLTAYGSSKTFTAAFDPPTGIPDGGATTVGLLGLSLMLLSVLRKTAVRKH